MNDPAHPDVSLWDVEARKWICQIPLTVSGPANGGAVRKNIPWQQPGPFRFVKGRDYLVGVIAPWIVLIDLQRRTEIRRVLPSEELLNPYVLGPLGFPPLRNMTIAVGPQADRIAAVLNIGRDPRVYIYTADLQKQLATWKLPRFVADVSWSPDEKRLAV